MAKEKPTQRTRYGKIHSFLFKVGRGGKKEDKRGTKEKGKERNPEIFMKAKEGPVWKGVLPSRGGEGDKRAASPSVKREKIYP